MTKKHFARLDRLYDKLKKYKTTFLGYPCDADFDYSPLYRFLDFPINNVGDPFESSTYRLETKEFEREALDFFAKLFHLEKYWGYVTNGGTEGNLYGLYLARETIGKTTTVFFSEHAHYSIKKNAHILGLKYTVVKSQPSGEMDYKDLARKIGNKKKVIIMANIGSTMTGAIDNVPKIARMLKKEKIGYYIHADAALYGMVLPFVPKPPRFDFRTEINSISVSGHKFIGSPIPCGIVLARKSVTDPLQEYIEYIGAHDTTLSGSRDAFTPLVLWYRIKTIGLNGFKKQVKYSNDLADFLVSELKKLGLAPVGQSYVTVTFPKPSDRLVKKWELAVSNDLAHVICLPHENKAELRRFVADLRKDFKL